VNRTFAAVAILLTVGSLALASRRVHDTSIAPVASRTLIPVTLNRADLYVIPASGGAAIDLSKITGVPPEVEHPTWSPDGTSIAFSGGACPVCPAYLYRLDLRRRRVVRLVTGSQPAWSRQGLLAFTRQDGSGDHGVYVTGRNGHIVHMIVPPSQRGTVAGGGTSPAWFPTGNEITFVREVDERTQVFTIGLNRRGLRRVTHESTSYDAPTWSPDGTRLAFDVVAPDGTWNIAVADKDGRHQRGVVTTPGNDVSPTWSPDGTRIAFASDRGRRPGLHSLYAISASGQGVRRLTVGESDDTQPAWSPVGNHIAFIRRRVQWVRAP
jgi:TolB protein